MRFEVVIRSAHFGAPAAKVLMAIGGAFNSLSVQHEHDTVQNSERMGPVDLRQCPRMKM